jgi:adenylate cyclase
MLCRKLDRVRVKGKRQGVEVYQPLCPFEQAGEDLMRELESHHRALELYWYRQWDAAGDIFRQLLTQYPATQIYQLYLDRIAEMRDRGLSADWDGIYERRSK